jgi:hypothetical protein
VDGSISTVPLSLGWRTEGVRQAWAEGSHEYGRDFPLSGAAGRAGLQPRRNRGASRLSVPLPQQLAAESCWGNGTQDSFASPCDGGAEAPPFPALSEKSRLVRECVEQDEKPASGLTAQWMKSLTLEEEAKKSLFKIEGTKPECL